jgi:NADPH2:quinone reductase
MQAITVTEFGGPEVLTPTEQPRPTPGPGQVLVEVSVAGINYMDVYQRTGATPVKPPYVAGVEGVGVVAEVGADVTDLTVGQRVGWLSGGQGSFADSVVVDAGKAVPIPDGVDDATAAAALMQGVTAHYLATDAYPVQPGDTVLVHAAAGGVGQLLTQVVKIRGGRVIGTVSTEAKAEAARAAGAEHVLSYDDFAEEARKLTDGVGVAAVYDGVGAATFDGSLASLRPRGTLLIYGTASGPTPPLEIPRLNSGGSLYVTRPSVVHYTATTEELRRRTDEVFGWIDSGQLTVTIGGRYPKSEVRDAFTALESRRTTGKLVLVG